MPRFIMRPFYTLNGQLCSMSFFYNFLWAEHVPIKLLLWILKILTFCNF
jgi:hypothetical protein